MTYKEWANEYNETASIVEQKMKELKNELKTAPIDKLKELNTRICLLYQMYLDCRHTADLLYRRRGAAY